MHRNFNTKEPSLFSSDHPDEPDYKSINTKKNGNANRVGEEDRAFHDWYRFVLSYPPHLVRYYIGDFGLGKESALLDPFCGCGTTLVEGKLNGIKTVGVEANPFPEFASSVKVDWHIDAELLLENAETIYHSAERSLRHQGINDLERFNGKLDSLKIQSLRGEAEKLLLSGSISPVPLHKVLVLLDIIQTKGEKSIIQNELLALGKALVFSISNLHFGPEVGVGKIKKDAPVLLPWITEVRQMARDIRNLQQKRYPASKTILGDSREIGRLLKPESIDAVITSPPYPNEKDYTRTTRLESVILGFIKDKSGLRTLKNTLLRSNTRNVYKGDDDDKWITDHAEVTRIADAIERRRIELKKDSGFEKMYGKVTKLYFGGMARHLAELRTALKPGANLAYVVGDQASYLRVMIRTGQLLADIAKALGYEVVRIDLFRTRFASATREQLREEVVILKWKG